MSKILFNVKSTNAINTNVNITFEEQLNRLSEYLKREKASRTGKVYALTDQSVKSKTEAVKACVHYAGSCDFTQEWINRVNKALEDMGRSPKTQMAYMYACQDFFAANGHPGYKFAFPKLTDKEAIFHSHSEIERLIKYAGNVRDEAILTVLYYGALRNKELRYLYVSDIDLRTRIIHVKDHAGIKGKAERDVPIPPKAIPAIVKWLSVRRAEPAVANIPYMFTTDKGELITLQGLTRIVYRAGKRAGIVTHPHALRHSRCSYLVNEGHMPVPMVQKIMGHKSLVTTQKYCHADLNTIAASIDSVGD